MAEDRVIFLIVVGVIGLFVFATCAETHVRAAMIKKCSPDPSQFECQLYLAREGQLAVKNSARSGAFNGAIIGGILAPKR